MSWPFPWNVLGAVVLAVLMFGTVYRTISTAAESSKELEGWLVDMGAAILNFGRPIVRWLRGIAVDLAAAWHEIADRMRAPAIEWIEANSEPEMLTTLQGHFCRLQIAIADLIDTLAGYGRA